MDLIPSQAPLLPTQSYSRNGRQRWESKPIFKKMIKTPTQGHVNQICEEDLGW